MIGARLVVRIAAVGVDGDDGRIVGHHVFAGEAFHEELLNLMLGSAAVAHAAADFLESVGGNRVDGVAGLEVRLDLLGGPGGFELRDQIGRADDIFAEAADQVGGSGVDH